MDHPTVIILDMTAVCYYTKFDLVPRIIFLSEGSNVDFENKDQ